MENNNESTNNEPVKYYKALLTWKPPYDDLLPYFESEITPFPQLIEGKDDPEYAEDRKTLSYDLLYRKGIPDVLGIVLAFYFLKRFILLGKSHDRADDWKRDPDQEDMEEKASDTLLKMMKDSSKHRSELFQYGYLDRETYQIQVFEADEKEDLRDLVGGLSDRVRKVCVLGDGVNTSYALRDKYAKEAYIRRYEEMKSKNIPREELDAASRRVMLDDNL
jgi:hypothetical protein